MTELFELPQIVSARTPAGTKRASALFGRLTSKIVVMSPEEAELAKLFTNVWRYIKFATANQLYMMANEQGLDFERIRRGLAEDYPRAADMPAAGFAAGPCLFKDTMQLAAFNNNNFPLGHAAMTINEGLPLYVVHRLEQRFDLSVDDRRHPRHGVQGRFRRHQVQPVVQAQADPGVQGRRGAVHRPVRDRRPRPAAAARRSWPGPTCSSSRRRIRSTAGWRSDKPVADIWNVLGSGVRV